MPEHGKLVIGDVDGRLRVVDLSGVDAAVLEIASSPTAVTALATIGTTVVAGHASGELRMHAIAPEAALRRACRTLAHFGRESAGCANAR
jgi:hypothetical protein